MPELASKKQCTGCTACVNVCPQQCIQMNKWIDGFSYPEICAAQCVSCGICEQVCPVLSVKKESKKLVGVYAAFSINDSLRKESSSGGVFSELATEILTRGGIIYGASYNENGLVEHICVDSFKLLGKLRGAKYSQSWLGNNFRLIKAQLKSGRQVLFSGTPCQVAGLKSFLQQEYDNLICIDFVCHGVPSPMVWEKYVKYRAEIDNNGIVPKYINLRNKETGWSKYSYSTEMVYSNNKRYLCKNSEDPFMRLFVNDYILRESCSDCHFKGSSRISDITLGDFWGIWDIDPEMDDNKGTSLVLTHSEKGEDLFNAISCKLRSRKVTLEQAVLMNPSLLQSSVAKTNREDVLNDILQNDFQSVLQLLQSLKNGKKSLLKRVRNIVNKMLK